jgi:hypothetical protein
MLRSTSVVRSLQEPMELTNASSLPQDRIADAADAAVRPQTLEDLLVWGRSEPWLFASPATITDVTIQDEFTHDVIVCRTDGLVLVYDST